LGAGPFPRRTDNAGRCDCGRDSAAITAGGWGALYFFLDVVTAARRCVDALPAFADDGPATGTAGGGGASLLFRRLVDVIVDVIVADERSVPDTLTRFSVAAVGFFDEVAHDELC